MNNIKLVVADVDGTLLTDGKELTQATVNAVRQLHRNGVSFTLASARPPHGLRPVAVPLAVVGPLAAFNGGTVMTLYPDFVYSERTLSTRLIQPVREVLEQYQADMWAYHGMDWYVLDADGPRVAWESQCTGITPVVIRNWSELPGRPSKIVGVSNSANQLARAKERLDFALRTAVTAAQSTPFYLDITPPGVDKGTAVERIAAWYNAPLDRVAVIGDGHVDVPMFLLKGVKSIAMGNAPRDVQQFADHVTNSNEADGFACAVEKFILA